MIKIRLIILSLFIFSSFALFATNVKNIKAQYGFIENKGQIIDQNNIPNKEVLYLYSGNGFHVQLRQNGFSYEVIKSTSKPDPDKDNKMPYEPSMDEVTFYSHRVDINFSGANKALVTAFEPNTNTINYYTTGTPVNGVTGVKHYKKVLYTNIYPGIDVEFLLDNKSQNSNFKYNFIVHPGADVSLLKLKINGANETSLANNGNIIIKTTYGDIDETIPYSYQLNNNEEQKVNVKFNQLSENLYGVNAGTYNRNKTLVIDPLPWGTYFGGSAAENCYGMSRDASGALFITGSSASTTNIATSGTFQTVYGGGTFDAFVVKFTSSGSLDWATYVGGTGADYGYALAIDTFGNIHLGGFTASTTGISTTGAHQAALGGLQDGFINKFNAAGVRIWGTYYGGASANEALYGLIADNNSIYAAGYSNATTGTSIASPGSYQPAYGTGAYDAFLVRFDTAGVRQWGTYYGGSGDDRITGLCKDLNGDILVSGQTSTTGTVMSTPGAHQTTFAGTISGHIAKFSPAGNRLWATYYGGNQNTVCVAVLTDATNSIITTGYTGSTAGIATPGAFQTTLGGGPTIAAPYDAFIARFTPGGVRQWGSYYGGTGYDIAGFGMAIDNNANILMAGATGSLSGIASVGSFQPTLAGGPGATPYDAFATKFDSTGARLWGTYYGGSGTDYGRAICTDDKGYFYLNGFTSTPTGLSTTNAYQANNGGGDDAFVVVLNRVGTLNPEAYNNASTIALVSPNKFCSGNQSIKVKIKNNGMNQINSVYVNWDIDGIVQTPIFLTSLLDTLGGIGHNDTIVTVGSSFFQANTSHVIKVWTSMPNNVVDTVPVDDSVTVVLKPALDGFYTIDPSFGNYTSFTAAVADLNNYGVCGPVTFNVTAAITFIETPVILTTSGNVLNPIVFQKSGFGTNPVLSGLNGTGTTDAVISLIGASYVTFDGIDVMNDANNGTTATQMEYGYSITNASSTLGSSNNIIKNTRITLNRTNTASIGITQSTQLTAPSSLSGANHNNHYENIKIENSYNGILLIGTAAFPDSNNVITSAGLDTTIIGGVLPGDIGGATLIVNGIQVSQQKNVEVSKSIVRNLLHTSTQVSSGIWVNNTTTVSDFGTAKIFNNTVYNLSRTSATATGGITGIRVDVAPNATAVVYNNVIYGLSTANPASASATMLLRGISHCITASGSAEYYNNSILIDNSSVNATSAALWKGGTGDFTYKNNILASVTPSQTGVAKHYGAYISAGNVADASNNILWAPNTNGFVGYATGDRLSLQLFAAAISRTAPTDGFERGSANADPTFASSTDLTFNAINPASLSGIPISTPAITTDILGTFRSATSPTIGAFETYQSLLDSSAPVITNVIINNLNAPSVYATIHDNSNAGIAGSTMLWYRSGTTGAFTGLVPDSVPTATINGVYKWSSSFSTLAVGSYQFYITSRDQIASGTNIAVNPIQSIAFTGFDIYDPANYAANPDVAANVRTFIKTTSIAPGTYIVGTGNTYTNLTDIATALGSASLTGNVIFELSSTYDGIIGETFPIVFNPFYSTGGNWNVTIRPATGVTSRITAGDPGSATPLIRLNGIDRISFDGRPNGTGSASQWTIRNTRTTATTSSVFAFLNDAIADTLQYLNIESQNITTASGSIEILTTNELQGNNHNVIRYNNIRDRSDVTGSPSNAIYSAGTALIPNDSNVIENNNIFNWNTTGIFVTATGNGGGWSIKNNNLYNNTTATTAQTSIRFEAGTASVNNTISGNFIGGSGINAGGSAWLNTGNIAWRGIVCKTGISDSSYVINNTIQNINLTGGAGTFGGIEMTGGLCAISGNTVGHNTVANSIQTSQLGTVISIWINNATNTPNIYNNTIANIASTGNTTAVGHNAIRVTTTVVNAPLIISNNIIHDIYAANPTVSTATPSLAGIVSTPACTQQTISGNTIYNLNNTANVANAVFGINISNASAVVNISSNKIYALNNASTVATAQISGIHLDLVASANVINNMIALGGNVDSAAILSGINDKSAATANNIFFNSVYISGYAASSNANASQAYRRTGTANVNVINNIFNNSRTGGIGNYAIANASGTPASGWAANYNALSTTNASQMGLWSTVPVDFATWKSASLNDTSSVNYAAIFMSAIDLHLAGSSVGNLILSGKSIATVNTDFDGQLRHPTIPYMGADENATSLPVTLTRFSAIKVNNDGMLTWQTASEKNSALFEIERSESTNDNWNTIGKTKAAGNSMALVNYKFIDTEITNSLKGIVYYRLKMIDLNGTFTYSEIRTIDLNSTNIDQVLLYPNPFNKQLTINIYSPIETKSKLEVTDLTGKIIAVETLQVQAGNNNYSLSAIEKLSPGIYFISCELNGQKTVKKIVKN